MKKVIHKNFINLPLIPLVVILLIATNFSINAQSAFISTWQSNQPGVSDSTSIQIPTYPGRTYNYDVDWNNDGIYDEFGITGDTTYNFGAVGTYTIRIRGVFPGIYFNNEGDKDKIIDISQWGAEIQWKYMFKAFTGCSNLNISATDAPDLSETTSLVSTFRLCTAFNSNINHWDVSNIEDFYFTFSASPAFNQPLNDWDISSATNLTKTFQGCQSFNQPLDNWQVDSVRNFGGMFHDCTVFNQPLESWNTQSGTRMSLMFAGTDSFNQDIGTWDISNVTIINGMFQDAKAFNQDIGDWDVSKVTNMGSMFKGAAVFNQDIGDWDVSKVTDMSWMFAGTDQFDQDIGDWDVSKVSSMNWMFFYANSFSHDIGNWNVGNVITMQNMLKAANSFNHDISQWDVSQVTDMNSMFEGNTAFDQNLSDWDISSVTTMDRIFSLGQLSTPNYDSTLIGWSQLALQDSVLFHGGNSIYCESWAARAQIIENFGWTITDKGYDQTAPTALCKEITVQLSEAGTATILPSMLDNGSFAHCTDVTFTASKTNFTCSDIGTLSDTLYVQDDLGNASSCLTTVTVIDASFSFNCPNDITVNTNTAGCKAIVEWEELTGDCSRTVSSNYESGAIFEVGTTLVNYTAVDENGNSTNTCQFNVIVIDDLSTEVVAFQNPNCENSADGFIQLSVSGTNAPFSFDWNMDGTGDFDDPQNVDNLTAGEYQVMINDSYGCTRSEMVTLSEPSAINLSSTTTDLLIDLTVSGGVPPYQFDWDNDGTGDYDDSEDITVSEGGVYTVQVLDANNCTSTLQVTVEQTTSTTSSFCEGHHLSLRPNPNSGIFALDLGPCVGSARLVVYDSYGRLVFQAANSANKENLNLSHLPQGAYFLRINTANNNVVKPFIIKN